MGMFEDAQAHHQRVQQGYARHERALAELGDRQIREIGEFVSAMRQLDIAPKTYPCWHQHHGRFSSGVKNKPTGEVLLGWETGTWYDRTLDEAPAVGAFYQVVTTDLEVRHTVVADKHARSQPLTLPYVYRVAWDGEERPDHLSDSLSFAVRTAMGVVNARRRGEAPPEGLHL